MSVEEKVFSDFILDRGNLKINNNEIFAACGKCASVKLTRYMLSQNVILVFFEKAFQEKLMLYFAFGKKLTGKIL